jgi:hypothetical protein
MTMRISLAALVAALAGILAVQAAEAKGKPDCISHPDTPVAAGTMGQAGNVGNLVDPGSCAPVDNPAKATKGKGATKSNGKNADPGDNSDESKIKQGFAISPVPLNLEGRNRALVGLGSYIVNAQGGCNDCHTWPNFAPGGDPYQGQPEMIDAAHYLAGGRPFGPFRSRNLTPDPTSPLTEEQKYQEFLDIMHTGWDPDQQHPQISPLLQVMPWPVYGNMTDRDLRAIFEYLQAIPHAEPYCEGANLSDPICQP